MPDSVKNLNLVTLKEEIDVYAGKIDRLIMRLKEAKESGDIQELESIRSEASRIQSPKDAKDLVKVIQILFLFDKTVDEHKLTLQEIELIASSLLYLLAKDNNSTSSEEKGE